MILHCLALFGIQSGNVLIPGKVC